MVLVLCMFVGTLGWEVLERVFSSFGVTVNLKAGPFGFDSGVISFWFNANPGTIIGIPGAFLFYRSL